MAHVFKQQFDGGWLFKADSAQQLYREQLLSILQLGQRIELKGRTSAELLNVMTVITEPRRARVHLVPGRRANPWLALSEAVWMLAGRNDVAALLPYNKNIANYSDDGHTLYGAYGYRIRNQLPDLVKRLKEDPNDRRAVLVIWRPDDLMVNTLDTPCNDMLMFKLRNGKLHMTVLNRSNDLHWGLYATNLCQFSILQEYIAARLSVELGSQVHISNSLHVYLDGPSAKVNERMRAAWDEPLPELLSPKPLFPNGLPRHQEFVLDCNVVLNGHSYGNEGQPYDEGVAFLEFASDFLRCYREGSLPDFCRHADLFADWVLAGKEFMQRKVPL